MVSRHARRALPLLAALPLLSVKPASAEDDTARHCRLFKDIERQTAAGLGRLIDPVTRLAAIDLQCDDQVLHFRQDLTIPERALNDDWLDRQRAGWTATYCRAGSPSAAAIRAGWTVTTTITTSDGARFRVTAKCPEEMAAIFPSHRLSREQG